MGAVLVPGAMVAAVVLMARTVSLDVRTAQEAARGYAAALAGQRWQDARDQLCAQDRARVTPQQLPSGSPRMTGFLVTDVAVTDYDGHRSAFTDIEFTTADGLTTTTHVPLVPATPPRRKFPVVARRSTSPRPRTRG